MSELAVAHDAEMAAVSKRTELARSDRKPVWVWAIAALGMVAIFLLAKLLL